MTKHLPGRNDRKAWLQRLSDAQLRALTDDEIWDVIDPEGLCPNCDDARLVAEARRRNARGPMN
jgi:hypothetical protein